VGGVPVISIAGVLSTIVVLYIGYMFLTNDAYAANSPYSLLAILLSIVGALAVFGAAYLYHRSQGLDIMMAFREIPPE
jgi:ABC-type antimicrobial peptide transport system permease subunit